MRRPSNQTVLWLALVLVSAIPRVLGAFVLPNAFGDAYVYIRTIGELSLRLSAKTFAITDLYGFWLPLYQFISAVINVFVGNGFYSGKVVSAIFGIGSCVLVYHITLRLTANRAAALLGFALLLPSWISLGLLIGAGLGIRRHVRDEEAYLARTYGEEYRRYAARVGRFVPGVGRLRAPGR